MNNYRSADVYVKEIDLSLYAKGVSTSVGAMLGVTTKGPMTPTLITSWPQFEETYGGLRNDSWAAYGVKDFFDHGGAVLYFQRVVHYNDITDETTITAEVAKGQIGAGAAGFLLLQGKSVSSAYNGIVVTTKASRGFTLADGIFDLVVSLEDGTVLENHPKLTSGAANIKNERYVSTYLSTGSQYVDAIDLGGAALAGTVSLAGGDDGLTGLNDLDFIGDEASRTGIHGFDGFQDRVNLIAAPGINSPAFLKELTAYAERSQKMFAICGTPRGLKPQQARDFRYGTGTYSHGAITGNFGAIYWPWIKFLNERTAAIDLKPNEGVLMGLFANNDAVANIWDAPAGLNRGRIPTALGLEYDTTRGERDELYDAGVNPLVTFPTDGTVVWGQKTLQVKPSALDRINVRRLLIYVEQTLSKTSRYLLFEPNDKRTWAAFVRIANPVLQTIKDEGGVYDYKVLCDETTNTPFYRDRNTMVAKVFVKPTKTAEFIELQVIVTNTGVEFKTLIEGQLASAGV